MTCCIEISGTLKLEKDEQRLIYLKNITIIFNAAYRGQKEI